MPVCYLGFQLPEHLNGEINTKADGHRRKQSSHNIQLDASPAHNTKGAEHRKSQRQATQQSGHKASEDDGQQNQYSDKSEKQGIILSGDHGFAYGLINKAVSANQ